MRNGFHIGNTAGKYTLGKTKDNGVLRVRNAGADDEMASDWAILAGVHRESSRNRSTRMRQPCRIMHIALGSIGLCLQRSNMSDHLRSPFVISFRGLKSEALQIIIYRSKA